MRTSPSGPIAITDQVYAVASEDDVSTLAPGLYYLPVNLIISFVFASSSFVPAAGAEEIPAVCGPETARGRLGRARIWFLANPTSAGSAPIKLQWRVNNVPVGNVVTIPWTTGPEPTTVAEGIALARGEEYDFGDVFWSPGDVLLLTATVDVLPIGTDEVLMGVAYDKSYDR